MDQNIKPTTAIMIILVAVVLISFIFMARQAKLEVGGPGQVQVDSQGNTYIHIADTLYKLSPMLELSAQYSLEEFGVYDLVGDFAFFANGDLLIRRGNYAPSTLESIRRYLRMAETKPPVAQHAHEGLYRCTIADNQCVPFGDHNLDFDSAFHVSIDHETDTVYISDTGRHTLRKFDSEGNELAAQTKGYKFPNQLLLHNNKLLVADTNHHAVQHAQTMTEQFGEILATHTVSHTVMGKASWTYSFAKVGDHWWVNNMQHTMGHGRIGVFNDQWEFISEVILPDDADPIDFAVFNDRVLITDLDNIRIYHVDHQGEHIEPTLPPELVNKLATLRKQQKQYSLLQKLTIGAFVLFLVGGFFVGIKQARGGPEPPTDFSADEKNINLNDPNIRWIERNKQKTQLLWVAIVAPLLLIPLVIFIAVTAKLTSQNLGPLLFVAAFASLLPIIIYRQLTFAIGVLNDMLIIKKSTVDFAAGRGKNIIYSDTFLFIGNTYVAFNRQQMFFNTEQIIKLVMPLLRDATYIPPQQMLNMLLKRQTPMKILIIFLLIAAFIGYVLLTGL